MQVTNEMRRLAAAIRAGEFTGDVADEIERFAAQADAEQAEKRRAQQDALGQAALRSQKSGNSDAAEAFLAAAGML